MASLNAVGTALGRVGAVVLADTVLLGYTRTHAVSGYRRINPFEVEGGRAPPTFTAPHSLDEWNSYQHPDVNSGDDVAGGGGYTSLNVSWTLPAGYSRDTANLTQRVYWRDMGTSEDLSINPFTTPTGSADAGDGTTHGITGLTAGHYYAIGVKVEWNDSVATHENADSVAYDTAVGETPLTGGGRGISSGLIFGNNPGPMSVTQTTDPDTCSSPTAVNLRISVSMQGTSLGTLQQSVDGGAFTNVDTSVAAGTSTINVSRASDGSNYQFRLRYNDVSPDNWVTQTGTITPTCNLL